MIDVVNGKNTFQRGIQKFENVCGEVHKVNNGIKLTIRAISCAEPISRYAVLVSNEEGEVKHSVLGEKMIETGFDKEIRLNNGFVTNVIFLGINRSATPSFPVEIPLKSISVQIIFNRVLRQVSNQNRLRCQLPKFNMENSFRFISVNRTINNDKILIGLIRIFGMMIM